MSAVITSDVRPIKGAEVQPPPKKQHEQADVIMASIQGEDHRRLAVLLDHRVGQLEDKVEANGKHAQGVAEAVTKVAAKVDLLIDLHKETRDSVKDAHTRLDNHIDAQDDNRSPDTVVGLFAKHPWLLPVMLMLGAVLFGSTAVMQFLDRT